MSVTYDKISTRDAFGIALAEAAREYPNLFAIGADTTKSMGFKPMMAEFPDRVINNGIAEQNMAMIGAGIAATGGRAVVATYAPFASMRISEQIRTFVCYPNLDVKVISGLGGLSGNVEGVTHQGLEDIGVMRSMANMVIAVPADAASCTAISRVILDYTGPAYLRIGRGPVEKVFDEDYTFQIGKANLLDDAGTDVAIICNGCAVARVLRAKALWEEAGIHARIIEMPCVKPIDEEAILAAVRDCGRIVTAEEHNVIGGLGSAVCEVVCKAEKPCAVTRIGIDDIYTESGPHNELLDKYNLSPEHIADVVKNAVK
ncbi:MAG: transketolase family protein [Acidaminococcaceae bacterium]|jgi:transketolase|nr:transketolase family protein [Acidaminococcaceae bacterium]